MVDMVAHVTQRVSLKEFKGFLGNYDPVMRIARNGVSTGLVVQSGLEVCNPG